MAKGDVIFRTSGLRELDKALGELPEAVGRRVARAVLIEAGEPTAKVARSLVRIYRGDLRESIDVSPNLARSQRRELTGRSTTEVYIGPGQNPQAITEEFGTFNQAPHPSMRPAWDQTQMEVLARTGVLLGDAIIKAARRHERKLAKRQKKG